MPRRRHDGRSRRSSRRRSSPRPTSRSSRSTSGRSTRWTRSATRRPRLLRERAARRRAPARTPAVEWQPGQFIRFARNPKYWGTAGRRRTRSSSRLLRARDTMVQALKAGELDYVRGVGADQFDALADEPNIKTVEGFANGYTYLSFNTRRQRRTATADRPRRWPTSRSATRWATRSTTRSSSTRVSAATACPGRRSSRRTTQVARRADHAADVRHRARRTGSSTPPATSSTRTASALDKEGKADHPAPDLAGLRGRALDATPSSSRAGSRSSGSASTRS